MTEQANEPRVFKIAENNMGKFEAGLAKLQRKADKIGCERPTYHVVNESFEQVTVEVDQVTEEKLYKFIHVVIDHPMVQVAGYEFLGTLEHNSDDGSNIVHCVPGKSIPLEYRNAKPHCDHCNLQRRRNDTFVAQHVETGATKQIGRNCLALYFGVDGERIAAKAELFSEFFELASASEGGSSGSCGGGTTYDHLDRYLSFVAAVIREHGWKSRSVAREFGGQATADLAMRHMSPSRDDVRDGFVPLRPTEDDKQTAHDAIAWCEKLTDQSVEESDYLYNIRTIARRGVYSWKQVGFSASIVMAYQKEQGVLRRKESLAKQAEKSEYVGSVGDKNTFKLTVDRVLVLDGAYGRTYLHLMYDEDGNRFTWSSSSGKLSEGKQFLLKGTIKDHRDYKGIKQTVLTRCAEVELHNYLCLVNGNVHEFQAENEKAARKMLGELLGVSRLPKGVTVAEKPESLEIAI